MLSLISYLLHTLLIGITWGSSFRSLEDSTENPSAKRARLFHGDSFEIPRFSSLSLIVGNSRMGVSVESPKKIAFCNDESVLRVELTGYNTLKVHRSSFDAFHYIISQRASGDVNFTAVGLSGDYVLPSDASHVFYLASRRSIESFDDLSVLVECMKTGSFVGTGYLFKVDAIVLIK